ncbi:MAG: LysR substrate-binding domain-containing protein [Candidatus Odinarchaeota archaeon]
MSIRIEFLYNFIILAKEKNFSNAAEEISLTQSALSQQVSQLEKFFDCSLIERSTRDFKLTKQGELLVDYSKQIWSLLKEYQTSISKLNNNYVEIIRISSSTIPGTHILPKYIANFKNKYNNANFSMEIKNTEQSITDMMNEKVHFAAIGSFMKLDNNKFEFIELGFEELVFICAFNHELLKNEHQLKLEDILTYPFIDREKGSGTRDVIEKNFKRYSELNHKIKMMNNEAIISAVSESESISLISEISATKAENAKLIKIIYLQDIPPIQRKLYLIKKKDVKLETFAVKFFEFIKHPNL